MALFRGVSRHDFSREHPNCRCAPDWKEAAVAGEARSTPAGPQDRSRRV